MRSTVAFGDAILLATRRNDGVHDLIELRTGRENPGQKRARSVRRAGYWQLPPAVAVESVRGCYFSSFQRLRSFGGFTGPGGGSWQRGLPSATISCLPGDPSRS